MLRAIAILSIVFAGCFIAAPARAQSAVEAETAIRATIGAQLDAFQQDDWEQAFSYASPTIQGIFGDPDRFSHMVRGGYPMVWRPQSVEYGELRATERGPAQRMVFVGPDGQIHLADYYMVEVNGVWRVNGVILLKGEQLGA